MNRVNTSIPISSIWTALFRTLKTAMTPLKWKSIPFRRVRSYRSIFLKVRMRHSKRSYKAKRWDLKKLSKIRKLRLLECLHKEYKSYNKRQSTKETSCRELVRNYWKLRLLMNNLISKIWRKINSFWTYRRLWMNRNLRLMKSKENCFTSINTIKVKVNWTNRRTMQLSKRLWNSSILKTFNKFCLISMIWSREINYRINT